MGASKLVTPLCAVSHPGQWANQSWSKRSGGDSPGAPVGVPATRSHGDSPGAHVGVPAIRSYAGSYGDSPGVPVGVPATRSYGDSPGEAVGVPATKSARQGSVEKQRTYRKR